MNRHASRFTLLVAAMSWLAILAPARAQVEVSIRSPHYKFLQYEPIPVTLTIRNQTDAPLIFGPEPGAARLEFDIEMTSEIVIRKSDTAPEAEFWTVAPWKSATREVNLTRDYLIRRQGPYRVVGRVSLGGLEFRSNRLLLDVLPGLELARTVALTDAGTRRTMTLRSLTRARRNHVFLQILDEHEDIIYVTQDLGPVIRHFTPMLRLSSDGTVHVLHQSAPRRLTHSVTRLDGRPVSMTYYGISATEEAALIEDRRGRLRVAGVDPYEGDPVVEPVRPPPQTPRHLR